MSRLTNFTRYVKNMEEIWKDIEGYGDKYRVSSLGRIKNYKRERILSPQNVGRGYLQIGLTDKRERKFFLIHRLVARAFIPNHENKPQVNHKDGNKQNNRVDNLEWCTNNENMSHAIKNGNRNTCGENNSCSKLTEKQVLEIREKYNPYRYTAKNIAEEYRIHPQMISNIVRRKYWKHI